MILWLDVGIGQPGEYRHLKNAFASNSDPTTHITTKLTERDYGNLIRTKDAVPMIFEGVWILLQVFDNEGDCLRAFEKYRNRRIFFITSGSLGQNIVPQILANYPDVFTNRITQSPFNSIYVFCLDMPFHTEWAINYVDYIQMFDFDADLLTCLTHDIANYFVSEGQYLDQNALPQDALVRFGWAKKLLMRYNDMLNRQTSRELDDLEQLIARAEEMKRSQRPDDNTDEQGSACS
ncbi:unnamed protein product [Didymodactylos carnosus]|nr:unnamed protein product [Didymodactylos carnosus]CAF4272031.1 unnamed protein product [Didymodactylos carnosus]